ncbi:MAG: chromosome partitioning protein ParB [Alphaproteobacteria bacterium]|nr:chromosome partitioning protein ParB [Alphaproteobacteria bacterium]
MLMKPVAVKLDEIYVPTRMRDTLDTKKVETIAESILEVGQTTPIQVRRDAKRFVLVSGYHRLEAMRTLGESAIQALIVAAPRV